MQEFKDGSFGDILPAYDLLAQMQAEGLRHDLKAVHFGSVEELKEVQKDALRINDERRRLDEVEQRLASLDARLNAATQNHHTHGVRVYPADALRPLVRETPDSTHVRAGSLVWPRSVEDDLPF